MAYVFELLGILLSAYLIGSLPTAYLVGRLNGINIFELGSGNMGATNVLRALGWFWGLTVMAIDIGKGIFAVWLAQQLAQAIPTTTASVIAGLTAVVGHSWSFMATLITGTLRGGKGAATAGGTWLMLMPAIAIAIPLTLLALIIVTTRYMSLAVIVSTSVGAVIITSLVLLGRLEPIYLLYTMASLVIVVRHRENIKRLLAGKERKLGERLDVSR